MEYFNSLPLEITMEILSRVPTETVLECKLVCRNWGSLVFRNPFFCKMHLHHLTHRDSGKLGFIAKAYSGCAKYCYFEYNENHESTIPIERIRRINLKPPSGNFVGSFNGLACLAPYQFEAQNIYICNPITREYLMLPEIERVATDPWTSGFGYVSSTNEYKVVTLVFENGAESMEVHVYTLGSGQGWRNLGEFNVGTTEYWEEEEGIFLDGAIYWLNHELEMIIAFDLAEEDFCEHLSLPLPLEHDFNDGYKLGVLDGCLSFAALKIVDEDSCWDVWLLKKKNDNDEMKEQEGHQSLGWSEVFRIFDPRLFAVTRSHAVLTYIGNHINIHDPEASTSKTILKFDENFIEIIPHKNTLVSLRELGEEDTKMMESFEIEETKRYDQLFSFDNLQLFNW